MSRSAQATKKYSWSRRSSRPDSVEKELTRVDGLLRHFLQRLRLQDREIVAIHVEQHLRGGGRRRLIRGGGLEPRARDKILGTTEIRYQLRQSGADRSAIHHARVIHPARENARIVGCGVDRGAVEVELREYAGARLMYDLLGGLRLKLGDGDVRMVTQRRLVRLSQRQRLHSAVVCRKDSARRKSNRHRK